MLIIKVFFYAVTFIVNFSFKKNQEEYSTLFKHLWNVFRPFLSFFDNLLPLTMPHWENFIFNCYKNNK